jgi:hypothetical protein
VIEFYSTNWSFLIINVRIQRFNLLKFYWNLFLKWIIKNLWRGNKRFNIFQRIATLNTMMISIEFKMISITYCIIKWFLDSIKRFLDILVYWQSINMWILFIWWIWDKLWTWNKIYCLDRIAICFDELYIIFRIVDYWWWNNL